VEILIAGVSVRGLAESAVRSGLGHRIVAVDHFGDFDLRRLGRSRSIKRDLGLPYDVRHLLTACRDLAFEALVYCANLENHPSAVEVLRRGKRLLGNDAPVLSAVRDPARFFGFLGQTDIPAPRICFSAQEMAAHGPGVSWLRKPIRSGGGHGIAVHPPGAPLEPGHLLQERVDGLPCSAVFVADGRECRLLGISEQLIGEKAFGCDRFRYCGSILGPVGSGGVEWSDLVDRTRQVVCAIAREFQLVGVNGMDFVLRGGAVCPLEINPRYTASMELVERAYGVNIFEAHLDACQGRLPAFEFGARVNGEFLGKAILYAAEPLVFHDPATWFERGARDLPFDGERIGRGKPVCTIFSRGATRAECYNRLVEAAADVYRASRE